MAETFQDVVRGEPLVLRADQINGWNKTGRILQRQQNVIASERGLDDGRRPEVIRVQNKTGAILDAAACLKLGDPVIAPEINAGEFQRKIAFQATTPAATKDRFCITIDPLRIDGIGLALVSGAAFVELNVGDASHEYATPYVGLSDVMASANSGPAQILWKESGTGIKKAYVLIGGQWAFAKDWTYTAIITSADSPFAAADHVAVRADITSGDVEVPLPPTPTVGDSVRIYLVAGGPGNKVRLSSTSHNILGLASPYDGLGWGIIYGNHGFEWTFVGGTTGWAPLTYLT